MRSRAWLMFSCQHRWYFLGFHLLSFSRHLPYSGHTCIYELPPVNLHAMVYDKCPFWAYAPSGFISSGWTVINFCHDPLIRSLITGILLLKKIIGAAQDIGTLSVTTTIGLVMRMLWIEQMRKGYLLYLQIAGVRSHWLGHLTPHHANFHCSIWGFAWIFKRCFWSCYVAAQSRRRWSIRRCNTQETIS